VSTGLLLGVRVALAAVFVIAGLAKLADRPGSRTALSEFGVPGGLNGILAIGLPLAELAVAASLLAGSTARFGAGAAVGLLLAFSAAITATLLRGGEVECHCFGGLGSGPLRWNALIRNLLLVGLAGTVVVVRRPGPGLGDWFAQLVPAARAAVGVSLLAGLVAAIMVWSVAHLLAQQGRILLRLEALEAAVAASASAAPPVPLADPVVRNGGHRPSKTEGRTEAPTDSLSLRSLTGEPVGLSDFRGHPTVLLFWNPGCAFCQQMLPDLQAWDKDRPKEAPQLVVVSSGSPEANAAMGLHAPVVLDEVFSVGRSFGAHGTPTAVLLDAEGRVVSPVVVGASGFFRLAGQDKTVLTR
jgi:thiol-disulfide isomerase/thioredoxin/uncharacterized membrane protein YphA (DoxX/SURF4 family)